MISFFKDFPPLVRTFLLRFFILFVLFETSIYISKDNYEQMNRPLTQSVAESSVWLVQKIHLSKKFENGPHFSFEILDGEKFLKQSQLIKCDKIPVLAIADSCNGLELYMLYIGFLISIPIGNIRTKTLFILFGTPFLYFLNVFRCLGLIELQLVLNKHFDFYHHYLFKALMYSIIFGLWMFYVNLFQTKKYSHGFQ